tara:strand:- start:49 stop:441 length:393 start_codon:yes stop_codon:yes gene_type:complete
MNNYYNYDSNFLYNFENIYKQILIYRSIVVVENYNDALYIENLFVKNDHSVFIIKDSNILNNFFNLDKLDERVIIITSDIFINLMNYLHNNNHFSFISLIVFYKLKDLIKLLLTSYYYNITKKNYNTIII